MGTRHSYLPIGTKDVLTLRYLSLWRKDVRMLRDGFLINAISLIYMVQFMEVLSKFLHHFPLVLFLGNSGVREKKPTP